MKAKMILLAILTFTLFTSEECEAPKVEYGTYKVMDKGKDISSHFNPFHQDNFAVETDYFVTLQNKDTHKTFVHRCKDANEYYSFQLGKSYKCNKSIERY